jgi:carbonic anhydrase
MLRLAQMAVGASAFDYSQNGKDWPTLTIPETVNNCGGLNQSPINLVSKGKEGFDYQVFDHSKDMTTKSYHNKHEVHVKWNGVTSDVEIYLSGVLNMFTSNIASSIYGASDEYHAKDFNFHSQSEHTIDGERMDLEMQMIH